MQTESLSTTVAHAVAERASTDPIAVLPLAALRICAPFAACDPARPVISAINIRRNAGMTRAEATNGHMAMRADLCHETFYCPEDFELKVDAKPFKKKIAYGKEVHFYADGTAKIIGGKFNTKEVLAIIPNWRDDAASGTTFPNIDFLWPDFSDCAGSVVAFNATYLATIAGIVKEFSGNGVMLIQASTPATPAQIIFQADNAELGENWGGKLAVLIMPVQCRDW
jgi:hypothetical protein